MIFIRKSKANFRLNDEKRGISLKQLFIEIMFRFRIIGKREEISKHTDLGLKKYPLASFIHLFFLML